MTECENCGYPIEQTEDGQWIHVASGRGSCPKSVTTSGVATPPKEKKT